MNRIEELVHAELAVADAARTAGLTWAWEGRLSALPSHIPLMWAYVRLGDGRIVAAGYFVKEQETKRER